MVDSNSRLDSLDKLLLSPPIDKTYIASPAYEPNERFDSHSPLFTFNKMMKDIEPFDGDSQKENDQTVNRKECQSTHFADDKELIGSELLDKWIDGLLKVIRNGGKESENLSGLMDIQVYRNRRRLVVRLDLEWLFQESGETIEEAALKFRFSGFGEALVWIFKYFYNAELHQTARGASEEFALTTGAERRAILQTERSLSSEEFEGISARLLCRISKELFEIVMRQETAQKAFVEFAYVWDEIDARGFDGPPLLVFKQPVASTGAPRGGPVGVSLEDSAGCEDNFVLFEKFCGLGLSGLPDLSSRLDAHKPLESNFLRILREAAGEEVFFIENLSTSESSEILLATETGILLKMVSKSKDSSETLIRRMMLKVLACFDNSALFSKLKSKFKPSKPAALLKKATPSSPVFKTFLLGKPKEIQPIDGSFIKAATSSQPPLKSIEKISKKISKKTPDLKSKKPKRVQPKSAIQILPSIPRTATRPSPSSEIFEVEFLGASRSHPKRSIPSNKSSKKLKSQPVTVCPNFTPIVTSLASFPSKPPRISREPEKAPNRPFQSLRPVDSCRESPKCSTRPSSDPVPIHIDSQKVTKEPRIGKKTSIFNNPKNKSAKEDDEILIVPFHKPSPPEIQITQQPQREKSPLAEKTESEPQTSNHQQGSHALSELDRHLGNSNHSEDSDDSEYSIPPTIRKTVTVFAQSKPEITPPPHTFDPFKVNFMNCDSSNEEEAAQNQNLDEESKAAEDNQEGSDKEYQFETLNPDERQNLADINFYRVLTQASELAQTSTEFTESELFLILNSMKVLLEFEPLAFLKLIEETRRPQNLLVEKRLSRFLLKIVLRVSRPEIEFQKVKKENRWFLYFRYKQSTSSSEDLVTFEDEEKCLKLIDWIIIKKIFSVSSVKDLVIKLISKLGPPVEKDKFENNEFAKSQSVKEPLSAYFNSTFEYLKSNLK